MIWLCELADMSPQNYYARRSAWRRQEVDVQLVLELARAERAHQPRLGVRKLYHLIGVELKAAGVKMGRDRLFEELRKAGLLVERKPSAWPRTTNFDPALPVFKNLIKGGQVSGRNQVWVADITYIRTQEAFMYLGLITDKWSRKIVGFHLGETLEVGSVLKALAMALRGLKPRRATDPPLGPWVPICVARLRQRGAASRFEDEHDGEESQRGECSGRTGEWDFETGILAGCEFSIQSGGREGNRSGHQFV